MQLIPATPADWPEIREMGRDFHAEDGHALDEKGENALKNSLDPSPYVRTWRIVLDGKTAGYGTLCFSYSIEFGGLTSYLDDFYVKPPYRGKGLGKQALQAFEQMSREMDCCIFHLEVEQKNTKAKAFYMSHGMVDTQRALLIKKLL